MMGQLCRATKLTLLLWALALVACSGTGQFAEGEPTPIEEPSCPEIADCGDLECGLDPVCGLECGPCGSGELCLDAGTCCMPLTCEDLGAECGTNDDGCGGQIECGVCALGEECNPGVDGSLSCTCPRAGAGDSVWIDIPTVHVTLQPLLDGVAPSTENTDLSSYGSFLLQPINGPSGVGWNRTQLGLMDSSTETPRSELSLQVMPGDYTLYYEFKGTNKDGAWPINSRYRFDDQLSLRSDQIIPVEIATVLVDIDIRVDGVALEDIPLSDGQVVEVRLEGSAGGTTVAHLDEAHPESSWILQQARLLPGGYQVAWSNDLGSQNKPIPFQYTSPLPLGSGQTGIQLSLNSNDDSLSIDIETATVTLALSQDGQTASAVGMGAGDDPRVLLLPRSGPTGPTGANARQGQESSGNNPGNPKDYPSAPDPSLNPSGNTQVTLPPFWDPATGTIIDALELRLLAGNYDVVYRHTTSQTNVLDEVERRWAVNSALIQDNQSFYSGAQFQWDLSTHHVPVSLVLDDEELSEASCEGNSGRVRLQWGDPFPGSSATQWTLPAFCDGEPGTPTTPFSLHLVEGSYDIHYQSQTNDLAAAWPVHQAAVTLQLSHLMEDDAPLELSIPVINLSLQITNNGTPLLSLPPETDLLQWPAIELSELGMDAPQHMGWSRPPSVTIPLEETISTQRLIPSKYTMAYLARSVGLGAEWPNASYRVVESIEIEADSSLQYDLEYRQVGIGLALNGLPASSQPGTPGDHGKLTLVRANPQGSFNWVTSWTEGEKSSDFQGVNLPAGHYQLLYYPGAFQHSQALSFENLDYDGAWPVSIGTYAGCLDVE